MKYCILAPVLSCGSHKIEESDDVGLNTKPNPKVTLLYSKYEIVKKFRRVQ